MRTTRKAFWIILFARTFSGGNRVSEAGSGYEVKCKDAKCRQPFVVIEKIKDMKFCPRCKRPILKNKRTVFYD